MNSFFSEPPFQVAVVVLGATTLVALARWARARATVGQRTFAAPSWRHGVVPGAAWGAFGALALYEGSPTVPPHKPATMLQLVLCFVLPLAVMLVLYRTGALKRLERKAGPKAHPGAVTPRRLPPDQGS